MTLFVIADKDSFIKNLTFSAFPGEMLIHSPKTWTDCIACVLAGTGSSGGIMHAGSGCFMLRHERPFTEYLAAHLREVLSESLGVCADKLAKMAVKLRRYVRHGHSAPGNPIRSWCGDRLGVHEIAVFASHFSGFRRRQRF
jgi:hypothetical protein